MAQIIHFTLVSLVLSKHRDLKCQQILFINNENSYESSSIRIFCLHLQIECLNNSSLTVAHHRKLEEIYNLGTISTQEE